jgi:hypothetical protein
MPCAEPDYRNDQFSLAHGVVGGADQRSATARGIYIPAIVLGCANDVIERETYLVRCMSPVMARLQHARAIA